MSNVFPNPPAHQPWLRTWMPEKDWNANPGMDDGFLPDAFGDPEPLSEESSSKAGALQAFSEIPFLFLLGRPGSGKSRELSQAHEHGWLGNSRWIEGKEFSSDIAATLDRAVAGATGPTRLFIDGLDEALLEHTNFVPKLKRWLLDHLGSDGEPASHLAITCRWADWPVQSVSELAALWQADRTQCLILCPLRRSDAVKTITDRFGPTDADLFWQQMYEHHLSPVACWPQGLLGLLEQFEQSGSKSVCAGYSQAIEEQISRHCLLTDSPDDAARWETGVSGTDWRRRVAGRLAAAMLWSGKNRLNLRLTGVSTDCLTVADFKNHAELWEHNHKAVRLEDLDGLRKTRLLRRLSDGDVWVFDSQVHQEALAAEWLNAQHLDVPRFEQLFGREDEGRWRVQPALGAVAAWLAGQNTLFRQLVLRHDPLILLRMDGARISNSDRKDIVEALLVATEQIRVLDPVFRQAHLASLAHPDLPAQLESWLRRPDVSIATRELALEIAEKAQQKTLAPLLWELYPQTTGRLQSEMAGALCYLAEAEEHDSKWQSVLRGDITTDKSGMLMGAAIKFQILSGKRPVTDALQWLVSKKEFDAYGLFDSVSRAIPEKLNISDLPVVFAALAKNPVLVRDKLEAPHHLHKAAVKLAIAHFERPEVAQALCDYWHCCLTFYVYPHQGMNEREWGDLDDTRRRAIIRALMFHPEFEKNTKRQFLRASGYLIVERDFDWGLDEIFLTAPEDRWRWALMLTSSLWRTDLSGERGSRLQQAWETMPELHSHFPTPLPDETLPQVIKRLAEKNKSEWESEESKWQAQDDKMARKFQAELKKYTQICRKDHEKGKITWGGVTRILSARAHGPGTSILSYEPISKIGAEDEWMIEAAILYLRELPGKEAVELSDGVGGLMALAACLPRVSDDDELRDIIRKHWLAPMLAELSMSSLGKEPDGISLERFAEWFPDEMPSAFEKVIRHRYLNKGQIGEMRSFQSCWSDEYGARLAKMLQEEPVQAEGFFNAMRILSEKNESLAVDVLRFWMDEGKHESLTHDQKAVLVGTVLRLLSGRCVEEASNAGLLKNQDLVKDAIWRAVHLCDFHGSRADFSKWSDESLQKVGELCAQAYTRLKRATSGGRDWRAVTGEDYGIDFRDRIISEATQRGIYLNLPVTVDGDTPEEAASRQHSVDWHRNEANKSRRKASRDLLPPADLFHLCNTPNARLARDPDELMAAVIASVRRWEQSLLTGKWRHLWDLKPLRARGEEDIAKELRDWLRVDLDILVEREVELYSEHRTDVLVQTLPQAGDKLTVLIELKKVRKGNAKERRSAMQTQLRDTYLKERLNEGWTHGLFIVAWTSDRGHKLNTESAMQAEAEYLKQQAENLSTPPWVLKSMIVDARSRSNQEG